MALVATTKHVLAIQPVALRGYGRSNGPLQVVRCAQRPSRRTPASAQASLHHIPLSQGSSLGHVLPLFSFRHLRSAGLAQAVTRLRTWSALEDPAGRPRQVRVQGARCAPGHWLRRRPRKTAGRPAQAHSRWPVSQNRPQAQRAPQIMLLRSASIIDLHFHVSRSQLAASQL